jgi:hypothetical protein
MSLSRHFYSLDEVQAALTYSTTRNNQKETLFWCQELLSSGLIAEAISTLFESWLLNTGAFRLQWLLDALAKLGSDELEESDILLAAYNLTNVSHLRRDNSIWNILVLTGCEPDKQPDRVTPKTPVGATDLFKGAELYFIRAIYQGKARCAWWITQFMTVEQVWETLRWFSENVCCGAYSKKYLECLRALEGYEVLLGFKSAEYDIIVRCSAVLALCISPSERDKSFKPLVADLDEADVTFLDELKAIEGQKCARLYSVPVMCLYGVTGRGRSHWSQQNFVKLNNVEKYMSGCAFWDEAVAEFCSDDREREREGEGIKWNSDESQDKFYERYFPDDIPDEWSRAEKLKSHGDGVLGPTEKVSVVKYTRVHFGKLCRLAWNTRSVVLKYLESIATIDCNVATIIESFNFSSNRPLNDKVKLEPVRKRLIVLSS